MLFRTDLKTTDPAIPPLEGSNLSIPTPARGILQFKRRTNREFLALSRELARNTLEAASMTTTRTRRRRLLSTLVAALILPLIASIGRGDDPKADAKAKPKAEAKATAKPKAADEPKDTGDDFWRSKRERMVQRHLIERGIKDQKVIAAFREVPRHLYVPEEIRRLSYEDDALPIGLKQTISPPFDVAYMIESLHLKDTDRVYEVGTGSGFNASIMSRVCKEVYSVEIHKPLSERATALMKSLGYSNVHTRAGDGYLGWPEAAPFDAVIVTCAPQFVPQPLVDQLKEGGHGHPGLRPQKSEVQSIALLRRETRRQAGREEKTAADAFRADDRPSGTRSQGSPRESEGRRDQE